MSGGASIVFNQVQNSTATYGTPGIAREDLWLVGGTTGAIFCQSANTAGSYVWSFLDRPAGSAASFVNADEQTGHFAPDVAGSYRVQLVLDGGGPGSVQVLIAAVRYSSTGTLLNRGWRLPSVGELLGEDNFIIGGTPNARGWNEAFGFIFADLLANAFGGGGGSTPPQTITATGTLDLPVANTSYYIESTSSIHLTFAGVPTDGLELTFLDATSNWGSYPLYMTAQGGGATITEPSNPLSSYATATSPPISGGAFTLKWSQGENKWLCRSVAFGYTTPFYGNGDYNLTVVDGVNSWSLPSPTTGTLTVQDGGLTGPATIQQADFGSYQVIVYNQTAFPLLLQGFNDGAPVATVAPGTSVLWCQVDQYNFGGTPAPSLVLGGGLSSPTIYDGSFFEPTTVAPSTFNQSTANIQSFQTTAGTPVATLNFPLPGTAGSAIAALTTPGLMTFDASIRLQDTTQPAGAWWKASWAVSVQTSGTSFTALGTPSYTLSSGTNAGAPPTGWGVLVQLDGSNQNLQVVITGDPANTCNGSAQAEWNNLQ